MFLQGDIFTTIVFAVCCRFSGIIITLHNFTQVKHTRPYLHSLREGRSCYFEQKPMYSIFITLKLKTVAFAGF